jgi:hypothetical protein
MSKRVAERSDSLNIFWLKQHGLFNFGFHEGTISWTYSSNENKIGFSIFLHNEPSDCMRLHYRHIDRQTEESSNVFLSIPITTTPCRYGGKRYWFTCPLCGRRVGTLFSFGKNYGCRHCGKVAYMSQNYGGRYKGFVSIPALDKAEAAVKRWYWRGKPTRKHRKLIRLSERWNKGILGMAAMLDKLDKRSDKFAQKKE